MLWKLSAMLVVALACLPAPSVRAEEPEEPAESEEPAEPAGAAAGERKSDDTIEGEFKEQS